ncbi:MAG TPA: preprotein translocase subunit SecG [bacterium]|nr:preprotein translocase subunit SecG [bacterium]
MYYFLIVVHIIACIGLIAIVLLQTGKGTGLANVFGSGGGVQSVFGAQTGDVLTRTTEILAAVFLITSISIAGMAMKKSSSVMATSRVARRAAEMPVSMPAMPASTQDLLKQIKEAAQGVKAAVQKSIPAAVEQGNQGAQTATETAVPAAAAPSSTVTEAAQVQPVTATTTAPAETPAPTTAPAEPAQAETRQ